MSNNFSDSNNSLDHDFSDTSSNNNVNVLFPIQNSSKLNSQHSQHTYHSKNPLTDNSNNNFNTHHMISSSQYEKSDMKKFISSSFLSNLTEHITLAINGFITLVVEVD